MGKIALLNGLLDSMIKSSHNDNPSSFIVFSDDWGVHPSSCQHLFKIIASDHKVIWVNTIGMRNPKFTLTDLKKIYLKLSRMLRGSRKSKISTAQVLDSKHVYVCQPFMLPYSRVPGIRFLNRYFVTKKILKLLDELDVKNPIVVSTVPNACDYISGYNEKRIIYYCVDDFTLWPGLSGKIVNEMEKMLIKKSDILFATSKKIYEKLVTSDKKTYLLSHGVDVDTFLKVPDQEHIKLKSIPKPRVGYYGLIDERSNQELIAGIAPAMKECAFVMAGPIGANIKNLEGCPNIYFTGPIEYSEITALIKGLDILFIPYVVNEFTDSISPLKLKEYLITGKPIVSTPLAEISHYKDSIEIASTVSEWVFILTKILNDSSFKNNVALRQEANLKWLQGESWKSKSEYFLSIVS